MDANGVCMVAIGLEQLGADEFVQMGFFDGGQFDEYCMYARVQIRVGAIDCCQ